MKTIFLLRHGKSKRGPEFKTDFVRPLAKRGKRDSQFMGEFMKNYGLIPALIISSDAERAKATAEHVASSMKYPGKIEFQNDLYTTGADSYEETIMNLSDHIDSVMLVGHNPDLEEVVQYLTGHTVVIPTAALVRIDIDSTQWSTIEEGEGNITLVVKPKGLLSTTDN